eukprot:SAG11_NODE_22850_length_399_cov_0.683333_1_plen_22_part_01
MSSCRVVPESIASTPQSLLYDL